MEKKDEYSRPQKGLKLGDLCNKYLVRHQSDVPRPPRVNEGKQEVGTGIKKGVVRMERVRVVCVSLFSFARYSLSDLQRDNIACIEVWRDCQLCRTAHLE